MRTYMYMLPLRDLRGFWPPEYAVERIRSLRLSRSKRFYLVSNHRLMQGRSYDGVNGSIKEMTLGQREGGNDPS